MARRNISRFAENSSNLVILSIKEYVFAEIDEVKKLYPHGYHKTDKMVIFNFLFYLRVAQFISSVLEL